MAAELTLKLAGAVSGLEADGGAGVLAGNAAGVGNMDRGGDVVAPGAFHASLPGFVRDGKMLLAHDWGGLPVGVVTSAKEVPGALYVEAEFLEDAESQAARGKVAALHARGRSIGLSVGFSVGEGGWRAFKSGRELYEAAAKDGLRLDEASCTAWQGYCRLVLDVKELFEFSLVAVPMNPAAYSLRVKQMFGGDGACAGLPLDEHVASALAAVHGVQARLARLAATRHGEGRCTAALAAQAKAVSDAAHSTLEAIQALDHGRSRRARALAALAASYTHGTRS